jgi:hypothetical protein
MPASTDRNVIRFWRPENPPALGCEPDFIVIGNMTDEEASALCGTPAPDTLDTVEAKCRTARKVLDHCPGTLREGAVIKKPWPPECVDCVPRICGTADCQKCPHCPAYLKPWPERKPGVLYLEDE